MSQVNNMGAPTPRRSNRISTQASSVAETAVTTATNGGTRLRRKGPLTKVKARKSNAYGASGRFGAAEELSVSATGFAQAFQNQRGDAFGQNVDENDDDDDDDDDDIDELGAETPRMSGALNGRAQEPSSPDIPSGGAAGLSFADSEGVTYSEDDPDASIGNTSKSFGPLHEAGMLMPHASTNLRFSSPQGNAEPTPSYQRTTTRRTFQSRTSTARGPPPAPASAQAPKPVQSTPARPLVGIPSAADKITVSKSIDELLAEEQARLRRAVRLEPQPQRPQEHQHPSNDPKTVDQWLKDVEVPQSGPSDWDWNKIFTWILWGVLGAILTVWLATSTKPSEFPESNSRTPNIVSAVGARVSYTFGKVAELIQPPVPPPGLTEDEKKAAFIAGEDNFLWDRMSNIHKDVHGRINEMHAVIEGLKKHLPATLIVRQHQDGRLEITDEFWHALLNKLRSTDDDPEWKAYLEQTNEKLQALFQDHSERGDTETYARAVSRDEFIKAIETQYEGISTRVDEKIREAFRAQNDQIRAVVQAESKKIMIENIRLQSLAQSTLLANYELHLRNPNYFSPGLGAFIDPKLTSVTYSDEPSWLRIGLQKASLSPVRNPPRAALYDWKEAGDCWCAAPNAAMKGDAQLAVSLGYPMIPKKVTIEHIPMSMVPSRKITNAPRKVELWVETKAPLNFYYSKRQLDLDCSDGFPGWECLGSFNYNIHAANHVQTFELSAEPSVPVSKVILRVVNNWGADHTCLYQVRLHGDSAEKDYDYSVHLNSE